MAEYDKDNLFAKIIRGEIPCDKVYEDDAMLAFNDINPAAPKHVLVIPKGEYTDFNDFAAKGGPEEVKNFFAKVGEIASDVGLGQSGYRLLANYGPDASQTIPHFHMHILGGKHLGPMVAGDTYH